MRKEQIIGRGLIATLAVLVGIGLWQTHRDDQSGRIAVIRHPRGIMGTTCTLAAIEILQEKDHAESALDAAEATLRSVEGQMSVWLTESEISQWNANRETDLSPETLEVLRMARDAAEQTGGAFDVTCRPLIELWRHAVETGRLPSQSEIDEARGASAWELLDLTETGASKRGDGVCVDLGGIAKGYAINKAIQGLHRSGVSGAFVEVGGDLAGFHRNGGNETWPVDIKDPFADGVVGRLRLTSGAVCTSGNYARFFVIDGKRYSHIIDPRSGRPAAAVPSVTVAAEDAVTADIWSTALSVLGIAGLEKLPEKVDALIIVGERNDYRMVCTVGMRQLLEEPLPERLEVWEPNR